MSAPIDPSGIEEMLARTRQSLDSARGAGDDVDAEPIKGNGEAAEGMIRVTAVVGGRLEGLEIDARAMRMTSVQLAEEIMVAANAALADLQAQIRDKMAAPDLDGLAERLREVQEQSVPQLRRFIDALTDAQSRIAPGGR